MGLVTGKTFDREVPHEPGEVVTFRRLSGADLKAAADARKSAVFADLKSIGSDFFQAMQAMQGAERSAAQDGDEQYDEAVLLKRSIVSWSYPEEVSDDPYSQLDPQTAAWAVDVVRAEHAPRNEVAQKNGLDVFTTH